MKRHLGRCGAIGTLFAAALLTESLLHAEPTRPEAKADREVAAQALYDSATVLMDAHDYANACAKLEEVTHLVPDGLGARLTLADCYEREKKWEQARAAWQIYTEHAAKLGPDGGAFPQTGAGRMKVIDDYMKLDKQYEIVRQRIAAEKADAGTADAGKSAAPAKK